MPTKELWLLFAQLVMEVLRSWLSRSAETRAEAKEVAREKLEAAKSKDPARITRALASRKLRKC